MEAEGPAPETDKEDNAASRSSRGSGPKVDRNAGISLVADLNFMPNGKTGLRDFFNQKSPKTDMEFILVAVHYMQHEMSLAQIGLGHIKTALKDVGKSIPLDLKQTVRNMKANKAWLKYVEQKDITTATAGDNYVLHEMGK